MTHTIVAPLFVTLPRKTMPDKKYILNKNNERNWHHIINNQVKGKYRDALQGQLEGLQVSCPFYVKLTYWKPTKRRSDRSNVLCVHEKFALDAMTHFGCIPDDSDDYCDHTEYWGGEVDRENPRVEIEIIEL